MREYLRFTFLIIALICMGAAPARSQSDDEMKACIDRSEGVTELMLDCGKVEIGKWDVRLNAAYEELLSKATPRQKAKLQREQRSWLRHHLRETTRLASTPDNGSDAFLVSQSFELSDLSKRVLDLEGRVANR